MFLKVSGREERKYEKKWDPHLKEAILGVLLKVEYSIQKMGNRQNFFFCQWSLQGLNGEWGIKHQLTSEALMPDYVKGHLL